MFQTRTGLTVLIFNRFALILCFAGATGCASSSGAYIDIVENRPDDALLKIRSGSGFGGDDFFDANALHWAARHGQTQVVQELLNQGMRVDVLDDQRTSPLLMAVGFEHSETAHALVAFEADIQRQNSHGFSAMHFAVLNGDTAFAKELIDAGANVNVQTTYGVTPLHISLFKGDERLSELLLDSGADPFVKTMSGESSLHWAVAGGHPGLVSKMLNTGIDVNIPTKRGITPLIAAAAMDNYQVAEILIMADAKMSPDRDRKAPLHFATARKNINLVRLLLNNGGNADQQDNVGWTPILIAAYSGGPPLLNILIDSIYPERFSGSRSTGTVTFATAITYIHLAQLEKEPAEKEKLHKNARAHLTLAKKQFSDQAGKARSTATKYRVLGAIGQAIRDTVVQEMVRERQEIRQKQINEIVAVSDTARTGGGLSAYYQELEALNEATIVFLPDLELNLDPNIDIDVAIEMSKEALAEVRKKNVENLLKEHGWETLDSETEALKPTSAPEFQPLDVGRFVSFGEFSANYDYCAAHMPLSLKKVAGTKMYGMPRPSMEDQIEENLAPIHLLWEIASPGSPKSPEEAVCARGIYMEQCQVAMDWQEDMGLVGDDCN